MGGPYGTLRARPYGTLRPQSKQNGRPYGSLGSLRLLRAHEYINSPRSLTACKREGVLPADLIYKPLETFSEKGLSPRLVKLRYPYVQN